MKVPKHLGIIPDGNRRFAKRLMLEPWKGHEYGYKKFRSICEWCEEYGINKITFWAFSLQNMNRPKTEFDYVMKLFEREARKLVDDKYINEKKVKVNFIGNLHLLPEGVQSAFKEAMEATKDHDRFELNIAIAYGGREDLVDAVKSISEKIIYLQRFY